MALRRLTALTWVAQATVALSTTIDSWKVTSSTGDDHIVTRLSVPGIDTSPWYTIGSKGTLMATLIENDVYNEHDLFYSTNLKDVDTTQFRAPWYYRTESVIGNESTSDHYYTLKTHGISSGADIWLNGKLVADRKTQAGAYTGLEYDISDKLRFDGQNNVLLLRVYPTDYNRDFALGFVDWNPYPPDNGTGAWREVELKRTGEARLSSPRITTREALDGSIDIFLDVKNMNMDNDIAGSIDCIVFDPNNVKLLTETSLFKLSGGQQSTITINTKINNPQLWWPRQWGGQPLYSIQCNASTSSRQLSDTTPSTHFGIRTVTSTLNKSTNDTTFFINGHRFQVLGAGYTSDIFLRFDEQKLKAQFQYVLDMGMNTVRLEGKQEHPFLYSLADSMGLMLLSGWECCDKWEGWSYNDEGTGEKWTDADYRIAGLSMSHEAEMMQPHPSMLGFLVGSDFWPDDKATKKYLSALRSKNWATPILASASQRGSPAALGNGGMKMEGPYDWVPPNYWYDPELRLGSAAGFGSEQGAGVGTPELNSLQRFLSASDMADLWKEPNKGLYHMSTNISSFYTREIYNTALWARYGAPSSLADYLLKAQMMDYEATRAQFDAWICRWSDDLERPATGVIYWMLNNAWPSLHWNLFDYYLHPGGSFFGVKDALAELQSLVLDYQDHAVYLVDRRLDAKDPAAALDHRVDVEVMGLDGVVRARQSVQATSVLNSAVRVAAVDKLKNITDVVLVRLCLAGAANETLSRKTYWVAKPDVMDWDNSTCCCGYRER
ncbi:glycoside hydrolase family 2 protein [Stemphylium lycopersici]|nr:glycoside hydrolase family 2 protein [Stemphylium lycopersici]